MKTNSIAILVLVSLALSSCAEFDHNEGTSLSSSKQSSSNDFSFTSKESENTYLNIKNKLKYKQIYPYDKTVSPYIFTLDNRCSINSTSKLSSPSLYNDFVETYNYDNPQSFLFMMDNGTWIRGYKCDYLTSFESLKTDYFKCTQEDNYESCLAISLVRSEFTSDPKKTAIIQKTGTNIICKEPGELCALYEKLTNSKYSKFELSKKETSEGMAIIAKEVKAKEQERKNQEREERLAEIKSAKEEKILEAKKNKCEQGNKKICFDLYKGFDAEDAMAIFYVNKACELGHTEACKIVHDQKQAELEVALLKVREDECNRQQYLIQQRQQQIEQQQEAESKARMFQGLSNAAQQMGNAISGSNSQQESPTQQNYNYQAPQPTASKIGTSVRKGPNNVCNCHGYAGVGGPCYDGPGGAAYSGIGGPAYAGVGGPCYDGVGGPAYSGVGGPAYKGVGGAAYDGVGGPAYDGVGGPAYSGVGGPCYAGPGGPCYSGVGGTGKNCPAICK